MAVRNIPKKYSEQSHFVRPDESAGDSTPFFSETAEETFWHSKVGKIWVSFYVFLIVIALEIGVFIYATGAAKRTPSSEPKEGFTGAIPTTIQVPVATDLGKYTIIVLNGSGIAGTAKEAKELLEGEKLTVLSIGNASSSANQETSIHVKQGVPEELIQKIKSTLAKSYILDDTINYSEVNEADITITIGRKEVSDRQR